MKPEHTRPFNREHAEAGAPYACANGSEAHVLRWHKDGAIGYFVGMTGSEIAAGWLNDGQRRGYHNQDEHDLVMVPLGMCQGKPVWWDSELLNARGSKFTANQTMKGFTFENCTWPVAAPVIETKMTDAELCAVWDADNIPGGVSPVRHRALAEAVLSRAIADGQVVPVPGVTRFVLNMNHVYWASKKDIELLTSLFEARAARDMAVAEAVSYWYKRQHPNVGMSITQPNLAEVIARVPK